MTPETAPATTRPAWQDQSVIDHFLDDTTVWAVVGLSGDPSRTAYAIADLLRSRGKTIVPVHPDAPTVFGQKGYATLAEGPYAEVSRNPDVIAAYLGSDPSVSGAAEVAHA